MSETSEEAPKRYQVRAPHIQYRRPNFEGRRYGGIRVSAWVVWTGRQNGVIGEDEIHPDDLAHLLQTEVSPAFGGGPMLVELPA